MVGVSTTIKQLRNYNCLLACLANIYIKLHFYTITLLRPIGQPSIKVGTKITICRRSNFTESGLMLHDSNSLKFILSQIRSAESYAVDQCPEGCRDDME